jgi:hypothetical protein
MVPAVAATSNPAFAAGPPVIVNVKLVVEPGFTVVEFESAVNLTVGTAAPVE